MEADRLTIHTGAAEPIYRQIAAQLRRLIASAQLQPGEPLPSVREVAVHHAINPMTVSRAYVQLEAEGLIRRLRGKGMVVADARAEPLPPEHRLQGLDAQLLEVARHARELGVSPRLVLKRLRFLMESCNV